MAEKQSGRFSRLTSQLHYLLSLSNNPVSYLGILITTVSALLILILTALEILNYLSNPYVGILSYLIMPFFFILGLVLIPLGILRTRLVQRRMTAAGKPVAETLYPRWDFNDVRVRRTAVFVVMATMVNVVIISIATYKGVTYMETVQFCGTVCHTVMKPEYTAYLGSPHARVSCTGCHIGPGASWFVKSKLSGVRQVFAVTFKTYDRPIPTPVHDLRPARGTCEECHWPQKFQDANFRVITHFKDDEKNTQLTTVLILKVGGTRGQDGRGTGIHWWHMDPANRVRYIADEKRQTIYWVEHTKPDGTQTEYSLADSSQPLPDLNKSQKRLMDCIDCHNRPTHIYQLPEKAVDLAILNGAIDPSLPFVKKTGVELLRVLYASESEAQTRILNGMREYYQKNYPALYREKSAAVDAAGQALQSAYSANVFPAMNVTWGTYPNNLGHQDFPGCWRCHDENHKSKDGKAITQDCGACHDLMAQDEENPKLPSDLLKR
jgi:nitrate/TMAO reductase-like tetraheme cytochrome c subunit